MICTRKLAIKACIAGTAFFGTMALIGLASPCSYYPPPFPAEKYDPALTNIDSVDKAENYIRSRLRVGATAADIAAQIEEFAARRFLHGYSTYSFCDNWLAYLAGGGRFNLKVPIDADDILRFPIAFCTQNTTVVQALMDRFSIPVRTVIFSGEKHMAVAARINGRWALYDGDLEPRRTGVTYMDDLPNSIFEMYQARSSADSYRQIPAEFDDAAKRGRITMTRPTRELSTNGRLFQSGTWFLSWFGWSLFAAVGVVLNQGRWRSGRNGRMAQLKASAKEQTAAFDHTVDEGS